MFHITTQAYSILRDSFSNSNKGNMNNSNMEILSRLKFIGALQKGDKIHTKKMYVQPDSLVTSISRTLLNQDTRANALAFIQETIDRAFEILKTYSRSDVDSEQLMCINITQDLRQAKTGLANFKATYISDIKLCCDVDTLLQIIDIQVVNMEEKLPKESQPAPPEEYVAINPPLTRSTLADEYVPPRLSRSAPEITLEKSRVFINGIVKPDKN